MGECGARTRSKTGFPIVAPIPEEGRTPGSGGVVAFPIRRISRNGLFSVINVVVGLATGFILIPMMLAELGASLYGLYALAMAVASYAALLDFGMNATLTKKVAEYLAQGDRDGGGQISVVTSTIFVIYTGIGALGALALIAVALPGMNIFGLDQPELAVFRQVALILAVQMGLSLPVSVWNSVLSGLQDYHLLYAVSVGTSIGRLVTVLLLLRNGIGLVGLVVVGFLTTCTGWLCNYLLARQRLPKLRVGWRRFEWQEARTLLRFSGSMIVWSIAGYGLHNADRVIIGLNQPLSRLAAYDIGARVNSYSRAVVQGWLDTLLPHASQLEATGDRCSLRLTFLQGTASLLALYGLVATSLLVVGERFLQWWIGPGRGPIFAVMAILVLATLFQAQNLVGHVMLVGMGRLRALTLVMACYPVLVVSLGWIGTRRAGVIGMATAVLIAVVLLEGLFMRQILLVFGVRFIEMLWRCQVPVLAGGVLGTVAGRLAMSAVPGASLASLLIGVIATAAGYGAACFAATPCRRELLGLAGKARKR
jgi:O-antigen/teichoic acid export membrane protein